MTGANARNPQAEAIFRKRYNGHPNVMTPRIYSRRMIAAGRLAVELSNGDGFKDGEQMWAVTALIAANPHDDRGHDLSTCFPTRAEAEAHIEGLRDWRDPTAIVKSEAVTGGERLTMDDGSVWHHPYSGGAPVKES